MTGDLVISGTAIWLVAFWVLPAALVANYARGKGYDLVLFLIGSLLVTWLVMWIVALLLPPRRTV